MLLLPNHPFSSTSCSQPTRFGRSGGAPFDPSQCKPFLDRFPPLVNMAAQSASEASPPSGETPPVAAHPNPVTAQPDQDAPSDLNAAAPQTEPSAPATADDAADDTSQAHAAAAAPPLPESLAGLSLSDPPVEASESQQQQQKQQKQQPASAQHHTSPSAPFSSVDATEHWPIKWIQWPPELRANEFPEVRAIIMQRHNGPCSFIGAQEGISHIFLPGRRSSPFLAICDSLPFLHSISTLQYPAT